VYVLEAPPLVCVEVVSRKDRISALLEKLEEYQTFGVPHTWVIDPLRKKVFFYRDGLQELKGDALTADEIRLPLAEVFENL
jgi:Uma2 family endonuclease